MARLGLGAVVRVLLTLFVALLLVAWLASTRLPGALETVIEAPAALRTDSVGPARTGAPAPAASQLPERGTLYIWRDASGSTRIQSEPPPHHVQAEQVPFVRRPANKQHGPVAEAAAADAARPARGEPGWNPALVYTPEGLEDLLRKIEETARHLEKRNAQVEDLARQL